MAVRKDSDADPNDTAETGLRVPSSASYQCETPAAGGSRRCSQLQQQIPRLSARDDMSSLSFLIRSHVLGRNADDQDARAAGLVHRIDDVAVRSCRIALHENDLVRASVVDRLEARTERFLGLLLGVDQILAA